MSSGSSSSSSPPEYSYDGAEFAFKPRDWKPCRTDVPGIGNFKMQETRIKESLKRLYQTLANKGLILKLPDKGVNIQKKINDLKLELAEIQKATLCEELGEQKACSSSSNKAREVIDVDEISLDLQRLSVQKKTRE